MNPVIKKITKLIEDYELEIDGEEYEELCRQYVNDLSILSDAVKTVRILLQSEIIRQAELEPRSPVIVGEQTVSVGKRKERNIDTDKTLRYFCDNGLNEYENLRRVISNSNTTFKYSALKHFIEEEIGDAESGLYSEKFSDVVEVKKFNQKFIKKGE